MKLLAIDFGLKNLGLAKSSGTLAEPLLNLEKSDKTIYQVDQICRKYEIEKIVVGISEGGIAAETEKFARKLNQELGIPVVLQDETLSSKEAEKKLLQAKAGKKKRRGPKHAFAAAVILQDYIDSQLDAAN